jgi:hypothetical protein
MGLAEFSYNAATH